MSLLDLLSLLGGTLAKGALLLLAAAAGSRLLRRRSAAGRYAVWLAAFASLLLLPALTLSLPSWATPRFTPAPPPTSPAAAAPLPSGMPPRIGAPVRPAGRMRTGVGHEMPHSAALGVEEEGTWHPAARAAAPWLLTVWLIGALAVLSLLVRDVRRISRVTRRGTAVRGGALGALGRQVAAELGIRRPVRIILSRELEVPVTWGLLRPVVLLPSAARRWEAERRRVVLRHELAHVRRGDYAGHLLIELACALHWVNPFAWRAAHQARLEQEHACDDRVLGLGTRSVDYAEHLLDIARRFAVPAVPARGALAMAAAATLPERMRAILDVGLDHRPAGRRTLLSIAAAGLLVGVPTAALHPGSDGPREAELRAMLDSSDPLLRREAIWALGVRRSTGARGALIERLRDDDPATRGVAAWALGKLRDDAAVGPLNAALQDRDANVREMAVLALGELGDPRAVTALAPLASDPERGVRSVMTIALRQIGGEPAAETLGRLLQADPDVHTRVMAASALGRFKSRSRLAALEAALADSAPEVRATAASALQTLGSRAAVPALLGALARESDPDASEALIHALGATGDPRATGGLVAVLADSSPELRASAAHMLGELGDPRAVEPLIDATRDPDHQVRLTAVWALDALQRGR